MEKQNVTLSIPKDTLRKAKILAAEQSTSLSALLTQAVEEIVSKSNLYEIAKDRQLRLMETGYQLNVDSSPSWTRDELHER